MTPWQRIADQIRSLSRMIEAFPLWRIDRGYLAHWSFGVFILEFVGCMESMAHPYAVFLEPAFLVAFSFWLFLFSYSLKIQVDEPLMFLYAVNEDMVGPANRHGFHCFASSNGITRFFLDIQFFGDLTRFFVSDFPYYLPNWLLWFCCWLIGLCVIISILLDIHDK